MKLEQGRRVKSMIEEIQEEATDINIVIKLNEKKEWGVVSRDKDGQEIIVTHQKGIGSIIKNNQQQKYIEQLKELKMAGMYFFDFKEIENWSNESYSWLTKWKGIPITTERKIFEILEQLSNTKYRRKNINNENLENDRCRLCNKKRETVRHILSNCDQIAINSYITRHNSALKVLYWWLLHKYKIENELKEWNDKEIPQLTRSNERVTIKWNSKIQSNEFTEANRPDITLIDRKKEKIILIEMSCPWDKNVNRKTEEKNIKYQTIRQELRIQYPKYKVTQSNIIIGTLGTITTLREELLKISKKAPKLIAKMQRVVIMNSISIIENLYKRE
jgi:hypothetical protein